MPQIDFIISNNGHHATMFLPVVKTFAAQPEYHCRVLSMCEFRGLPSPAEKFDLCGVTFVEVLPFKNTRKSSAIGSQKGISSLKLVRQIARQASWHLLLGPKVRSYLKNKANLVVVANDAAFPYNHICHILRQQRTPFVLLQEGIRFPIPSMAEKELYGTGGAVAVAAWGSSSVEYFRQQGVSDDRIHLTGTPRFDIVSTTDWQLEAAEIKKCLGLGTKTLLYLSNPIDDQGFCTTPEKMKIFRHFLIGIESLFADPEFSLVVKLHTREAIADFEAIIAEIPFAKRTFVLSAGLPYPFFILAQAAIVLASTVGLEALMFGLPLGVLEIPLHGFIHDYVSSGAAYGLKWDASMSEQVRELMQPDSSYRLSAQTYVANNLITLDNSTERVVNLIDRLINNNY